MVHTDKKIAVFQTLLENYKRSITNPYSLVTYTPRNLSNQGFTNNWLNTNASSTLSDNLTNNLVTNYTNSVNPTTNSSWWTDFNGWVKDNFKNGWFDLGQLGLGALTTGFGIYGGLKQLGLAQDQFNFTKDAFNANLANSIKSYNTALEDRARSRYAYMTGDASNADEYIEKNRL